MVCCSSASGGGVGVGLVQGLHRLLEDRLHARPPLLPEAARHAHDRVGGAVAVAEDARVEQVDAGRAAGVGEVDEPDLSDQRLRDVPEDALHEVGVGVDDDDRVAVAPRRLLLHLVLDEVLHERRLPHARARRVEVVPARRSSEKRISRGAPVVVWPTSAPPRTSRAEGMSTRAPERATSGVSSLAPGGCQRQAASRTPSTLRPRKRPGPGGCMAAGSGSPARTLPTRKRAPAGWS